MKKLFFIIVLLIVCCLNISDVNADDYDVECVYFADGDDVNTYATLFDYEIKDGKLYIAQFDYEKFVLNANLSRTTSIMDLSLDRNYLNMTGDEINKKLVKNLNNGCLRQIEVCFAKTYGVLTGIATPRSALLDMQFETEAKDYTSCALKTKLDGDDPLEASDYEETTCFGGKNVCFTMSLSESYSKGEVIESMGTCNYMNTGKEVLRRLHVGCVSKVEDDDLVKCNAYNTKKNQIANYCSSLLQFGSYSNPCIKDCNNFSAFIAELENTTSEGACGLSDRIVKFIANILKWMKYIAPVLVIILGILDFIKSLISQNDDEMKKSQGKFIKRLIAAALLFIIPFMIEFVLDVFDLISDNPFCNLL